MNTTREENHFYEHRVTRLEVVTENINSTLMRLERKIDGLDKKIDEVEHRLNKKIDEVEHRLNKKIDEVEKNLNDEINEVEEVIHKRIDRIEIKLDKLDSKLWQIPFLIVVPIIGHMIAKYFHWI